MLAFDIFEELRFIIELVVAEQLFAWNFGKRKQHFWKRNVLWNIVLCILAVSFIVPRAFLNRMIDNYYIVQAVSITWYIFLSMLSIIQLRRCFYMTMTDTIFIAIAGYSVQHLEYVVVNEVITMGLFPFLKESLLIYALLCIATCALWYAVIGKIFASKLRSCNGLLYENQASTITYFTALLVVLFTSSFICQDVFLKAIESNSEYWYQGAIPDFTSCTLIILVQYSIFRISTLNREKEIVKHLLHERQKQYEMSKENIEIINRKCHDLKHQIQALRTADSDEIDRYIGEVEQSIEIYDNVVKTENEVLNTILSEKSLYCEKHHIKLTCIIDSSQLDFMSTLDIYALLGNALDNAIECVSKYQDTEKRVISLTISARDSFLCIQMNNYYEGEMQMEDGLPVTTKRRKAYHGFGMKSMRHLTQKYGGTLYTQLKDGIFMLQIVIPMPKEFLRLLKESKQ